MSPTRQQWKVSQHTTQSLSTCYGWKIQRAAIMNAEWNASRLLKPAGRGTTQSAVLSPAFWIYLANQLLGTFEGKPSKLNCLCIIFRVFWRYCGLSSLSIYFSLHAQYMKSNKIDIFISPLSSAKAKDPTHPMSLSICSVLFKYGAKKRRRWQRSTRQHLIFSRERLCGKCMVLGVWTDNGTRYEGVFLCSQKKGAYGVGIKKKLFHF